MRKTLCYVLAVLGLALAMSARAMALSLQERIDAIVAHYLEASDFMGVVGIQVDGMR